VIRRAVVVLAACVALFGAVVVQCVTLRGAWAFPLRVVAASELRVEPRLSSDQRTLTLALRLRDDRGAALVGRSVRVQLRAESFPFYAQAARTDERGDATVQVDLREHFRVFQVEAHFEGDATASPTAYTTRLDLDVPFVEAELLISPSGFELGAGPSVVTVRVRIGEVVARSVGGLPVALVLDPAHRGRVLVAGVTDGAGRAELRVPPEAFGAPGVHPIAPRVELGRGRTVDGAARSVLVRAQTRLGVARGADDAQGVVLVGHASAVGVGALADAAVRLQAGERVLAGGRTDTLGNVMFRVPWSAMAEGPLTVHALLDPTEPWLLASASTPMLLRAPVSAAVPWWWAASAMGGALVVLGAVGLRERFRKVPPGVATASIATPSVPVEGLVRESVAGVEGVSLRVEVSDRTTGMAVVTARCRVEEAPPEEAVAAREALPGLRVGQRIVVRVEAPGYAPRSVPAALLRPGSYLLRVALRNWREELFELLRPLLLRRRGVGTVLPTLREALRDDDSARLHAVVSEVERGCYGPEALEAEEVARVSAMHGRESAPAEASDPGRR